MGDDPEAAARGRFEGTVLARLEALERWKESQDDAREKSRDRSIASWVAIGISVGTMLVSIIPTALKGMFK